MHNMIVEDRREDYSVGQYEYQSATDVYAQDNAQPPQTVSLFGQDNHLAGTADEAAADAIAIRVAALSATMVNDQESLFLKGDLVEHVWRLKQQRGD